MAELQAAMTPNEFQAWCEFYRASPFCDGHRYHRPAALIAGRPDGKVAEMLDWLAPEKGSDVPLDADWSAADINTLKALGFTPPKRKE